MKYLEILELTQLDYDAVRNTLPADKGVIIIDNPTANFAIGDGQFATGGGSTLTQTFLTYTDQSGTLTNAINIGGLAADATNNVLTFSVAGTSATPTATTIAPSTFAVANALGELEFTNSIVTGDQILSIDTGTSTIGLTSATNTLTGVNALVGATTVTGATTLNGQLTNTTGNTPAVINAGTSTIGLTSATNTLTGVNALVGATTVTGATTLNGQLTNTTGNTPAVINAGTSTIGLTSATNTLTGVNALVGATTVTGATTLNGQFTVSTSAQPASINAAGGTVSIRGTSGVTIGFGSNNTPINLISNTSATTVTGATVLNGQLTNTTGNTAARIDAGTSTVSLLGTGGIFLGNLVGSTAISLLSGTGTTNLLGAQIILASADTRLTLIPAGTGTALNIDANGTIQSTVSSLQFKENILDYTDEELNSARVFDLVPKKFTFKGSGKASYGFIAEEVHEILPEVVNLCKEGKPYSIQYEMIPFFLLNEVKKLKTQVDALTAQVAALAP